jgi:hypothetical protein
LRCFAVILGILIVILISPEAKAEYKGVKQEKGNKMSKVLVGTLNDNRVCVYYPKESTVVTYNNAKKLRDGQTFGVDRDEGWRLMDEDNALKIMRRFKQLNTQRDYDDFYAEIDKLI